MKRDETNRKYMIDFISRICSEIGPRLGTTENEKRAGLETKKESEKFMHAFQELDPMRSLSQ
ncbi:MAG: hypothetical protein JSV75_04810 [Candidatus Bathyarchaeota archaeon]|nr:MAG: hypothetical protein JSV75_04810 [Candidatus Bathyarchaeota archaeon]